MKIEFVATLQGAACIKFDDDGSAVVKLTCDGSQLPNVTRLLVLQGKSFTVKIEEAK